MKKILAIILAAIMMLSLAACGDDGDTEQTTQNTNEKETDGSEDVQIGGDGETLKLSLLSLNYDPAVWTCDEEELYDDEEYSKVILIIPGEEDSYVANAEISVSIEDPEDFRDYLDNNDFDAYEYAVNNAYDLVNVGGVDCLKHESEYWGESCLRYFGRVEEASATVFIEILGDCEDSRVEQLLAGLTVTVEDIGNVDCPWPWDGEAFSASDASAMAGTYTVNSQWLPITECIITDETFDHAVAVVGGYAYILGDGGLKQYAYDGTSLVYEKDITIDGDYTNIQSTADGTVWISGFMEPLVSLKDGVQTGSYEDVDIVTMHPSGAWGISWFSGPECEKITLSNGTISASPITFAEVDTISSLHVDENYIYVCGSAADDSGHKVYIYNADGVLQMTLTDAEGEGLGSITFMAQTGNGFLGLDGNMREVVLWTNDGTVIGTIEDSDLFGTYYPWFCGGTKLSDGSILAVMTEDRADESAMELVAFKLSGF